MTSSKGNAQPQVESRPLTVLLVEDERAVARLTAEWLRRLDYEVIVCANGKEASELASARDEPIDLLLADVMLPGMSGPVLAGALRGRHPEMAVLFTSGYSPELLGEMFSSTMDSAPLLYKPYTAEQLAARVQLTLARRAASLRAPDPTDEDSEEPRDRSATVPRA
jgi:two-component system cell cycle sensor histidine kinase/response regulator CckA